MMLLAKTLQVGHRHLRDHGGQLTAAGAQNLEPAEVAHPASSGIVLGPAPADSDSGGHRDPYEVGDALGADFFGRQGPALYAASRVKQSRTQREQDDYARPGSHVRLSCARRRRTVAGLGPPIMRRRRSEVSA